MFDELVARQDGVLTRQQALGCGLSRATIEAQLRARRWQRLTGRVYAVFTGDPPRRAQLWAAVLRAGRVPHSAITPPRSWSAWSTSRHRWCM